MDPRITAPSAREDAALLARDLRGALAVIERDGAGDDRFVLVARLVGYDEAMVVFVDVLDKAGKRVLRLEVAAEASKRGWTGAARENARDECVRVIAGYLRDER